jgi:hypothetical protein
MSNYFFHNTLFIAIAECCVSPGLLYMWSVSLFEVNVAILSPSLSLSLYIVWCMYTVCVIVDLCSVYFLNCIWIYGHLHYE